MRGERRSNARVFFGMMTLLSACGATDADTKGQIPEASETRVKPSVTPQPTTRASPTPVEGTTPETAPTPAPSIGPFSATGLFLGNSQFDYCSGSLAPLVSFASASGDTFSTTQKTGSAQLVTHTLPGNITNFSHVYLTNQEAGWFDSTTGASDYADVLTAAKALHSSIAGAGAKTVLWMTYLVGQTPSTGTGSGSGSAAYRDQVIGFWRQLETDLEAHPVAGTTRDVLLIPTLELWELGKAAYPIDTGAAQCSAARGFLNDPLHGSLYGKYATAVLMHTFTTCKDPRGVADTSSLPVAVRTWAKQTAWTLFQSSTYRPDHCP